MAKCCFVNRMTNSNMFKLSPIVPNKPGASCTVYMSYSKGGIHVVNE